MLREECSVAIARSCGIPCDSNWDGAIQATGLSGRQARIVAMVFEDKADKQIAAELGLSKDTVRTYMKRIFTRLGVNDRVGLVLRVVARPPCTHEGCPLKR